MKKVIRKLFFDYEREEKWINEMASKGLNFSDYSFPGRYLFEEGNPGEYAYKIELLKELPIYPESETYIRFMEENNIEHVSSYFRWIYLRSKEKESIKNLYSDYESRLQYHSNIVKFISITWLINFSAFIGNLGIGIGNFIRLGMYFNLICSLVSLIVTIFVTPILLKERKKVKLIKKQREIYE